MTKAPLIEKIAAENEMGKKDDARDHRLWRTL